MKDKMGLIAAVVVAIACAALLFFYLKNRQPSPDSSVSASSESEQPASSATPSSPTSQEKNMKYDLTVQADGLSKAVATMTLEKGGVIKFRFFTNDAPNTAKRIAELISQGFYNGIKFHRVIPGVVAQAGDPTGTGAGGSGVKLKAEFNSHLHEAGIWSMARTQDPNSADSQFFVMLGRAPHLDNQYTVFGKVVEGMDNVMQIQQGDKIGTFTIE
jgi:peptidylprolyl isomerase